MLNILRDGLPTNNLHAYCRLSNIQYLPDIDNKMQEITLYLETASDIQILMKMLASPRPDGQQRVIYIPCEQFLISKLLNTIKKAFRASIHCLAQPFYICFYGRYLDMQRSAETNEQTDEQLTIMPPNDDDTNYYWEIYRHPRGQHEQWTEDGRNRVKSICSNEHFTRTRINVDL